VLAATSSALLTPALLLCQERRHGARANPGFRCGRQTRVMPHCCSFAKREIRRRDGGPPTDQSRRPRATTLHSEASPSWLVLSGWPSRQAALTEASGSHAFDHAVEVDGTIPFADGHEMSRPVMGDFGWLAPQVARLPSEQVRRWRRTSANGSGGLARRSYREPAYIRLMTSEAATGGPLNCDS
jgi:hypothetical protein